MKTLKYSLMLLGLCCMGIMGMAYAWKSAETEEAEKRTRTEELKKLVQQQPDSLSQIADLIKNGVDIEGGPSYSSWTPLMTVAAWNKSLELAQLLLDHGAQVNAESKNDGQTSLHFAVLSSPKHHNNLPLIKLLLKYGANVNTKDKKGLTPLHYSVGFPWAGVPSITKLLLDHHADVHAKDIDGRTPLHYAVKNGFTESIEALIKNGADVLAKDNNNQTPLDLAGAAKKDILGLAIAAKKDLIALLEKQAQLKDEFIATIQNQAQLQEKAKATQDKKEL